MNRLKKLIVANILMCLSWSSIYGQVDSTNTGDQVDDIFSMSLEELINMNVEVGSKNSMSIRETPGIVTVVTEEEIRNSGARNMMDVLRTVPGLDFAGEVDNTIGLGVRGNYALEGKALMLIDGQQIPEVGYGSINFSGRFSLDNISKIEIIRGPGAAVYGGVAELAVINVITKSGEDLDGQNSFLKIVKDITSKGFVRNNYNKNLIDLSDIKINLKGKK